MEFLSVIPSVNPLVIKNYYRGIYRWNKAGNFIFYYQRIYRRTKNYRRKIYRRSIFVGDFVGKLITDRICVLRRQKNSVGKTIKSYNDTLWKSTLKIKLVPLLIFKSQTNSLATMNPSTIWWSVMKADWLMLMRSCILTSIWKKEF